MRTRGLPLSEKLNRAEEWHMAVPRAIKEELGSALPDTPNVWLSSLSQCVKFALFANQKFDACTFLPCTHGASIHLKDSVYLQTGFHPKGHLHKNGRDFLICIVSTAAFSGRAYV